MTAYAGPKAGLKPIYDAVLAAVAEFGGDVEVGLSLKGVESTERLETWGAMCSHRVRVSAVEQVDAELVGWLKQVYDAS